MCNPVAVYRIASKSDEAFLQGAFSDLSTAEEYAQELKEPGIKFLAEVEEANPDFEWPNFVHVRNGKKIDWRGTEINGISRIVSPSRKITKQTEVKL
ncbi:MAG: hypothetical protein ABIH48_00575 [Candidatus Falkowbacteria bacterium]